MRQIKYLDPHQKGPATLADGRTVQPGEVVRVDPREALALINEPDPDWFPEPVTPEPKP